MNTKVREEVMEVLKVRNKHFTMQAEYLIGAMQMYLALNPESEQDGSWCPPSWVFGIVAGIDFTEEE